MAADSDYRSPCMTII